MWIMLSDCFFSIVRKDCARDELLVRARRRGDIEKLWPGAEVTKYDRSDYLFRAKIKIPYVIAALNGEVHRINYDNFKDSVKDDDLHDAYMRVWVAMAEIQETPPYGNTWFAPRESNNFPLNPGVKPVKKRQRRKRRGQ